jgi:hypothetical protein
MIIAVPLMAESRKPDMDLALEDRFKRVLKHETYEIVDFSLLGESPCH